jgi:hypothetical protein
MRNIAKSSCQTNFTFVPDVDMIPNPGLDLSLENFLMEEKRYSTILIHFSIS